MPVTVKARYERGALRLLGDAGLREGEEVEVIIVRRRFTGFREKLSRHRFVVDRDVVEEYVSERR